MDETSSRGLSGRAAARRLGVSDRTVRGWIRSGRLPATRTAEGVYAVDPAALDRLAAEQSAAGADVSRGGAPHSAGATSAALDDALALISRLHDENQQLAGQCGFLQAQVEAAREQVRLLQVPPAEPEPSVAPLEPAPRPSFWRRLWGAWSWAPGDPVTSR